MCSLDHFRSAERRHVWRYVNISLTFFSRLRKTYIYIYIYMIEHGNKKGGQIYQKT